MKVVNSTLAILINSTLALSALISVQVNIAESIAVLGVSDKTPMIEPILENLRATDRMMMDADEEEIDDEKNGSED